jgi:glyoxylase-like metal-dependent hydrolase (beta-lactamase superfamily II)
MAIPLEDKYADILAKAQRGLRLGDAELAEKSGLTTLQVGKLKAGQKDPGALAALADVLALKKEALLEMADGRSAPPELEVVGLECFNTPFEDMTVNSYLVFDKGSGRAAAFDTGADAGPLFAALKEGGLKLQSLFLTHTHGDHVYELDRIREKTGAEIWVGEREPLEGARTFAAGRKFQVGSLEMETRQTWGHSEGGITYLIHGLERPVAVVGDALFASSMGGGMVSYKDALATNRESLFSLPDDTVLCPGHGPLTTVKHEKKYNPFYPEFPFF